MFNIAVGSSTGETNLGLESTAKISNRLIPDMHAESSELFLSYNFATISHAFLKSATHRFLRLILARRSLRGGILCGGRWMKFLGAMVDRFARSVPFKFVTADIGEY